MNERRGPWYLITGLVIGLLFGLLYTWVVNPTRLVDTSPDRLAPAFKEHYRSMIALAYESSGDLGRAEGRLKLLNDDNAASELSAQAQRIMAQGGSPQEARALAALAAALGGPPAVEIQATPAAIGSSAAEEPSSAPAQPQPTPAAAVTPETNVNAPFVLKQRETLCDSSLKEGILQVDVMDAGGRPVPGVRLTIRWVGGEETFATGLNPAISSGYADYTLQPDVEYSLQAGTGDFVTGITTQDCQASNGRSFTGGWRLLFVEE